MFEAIEITQLEGVTGGKNFFERLRDGAVEAVDGAVDKAKQVARDTANYYKEHPEILIM